MERMEMVGASFDYIVIGLICTSFVVKSGYIQNRFQSTNAIYIIYLKRNTLATFSGKVNRWKSKTKACFPKASAKCEKL